MKRILISAAAIIAAALSANAQQVDTIKISNITTTHIRFSSEIKYVDLSNKVLAAKIVEGSRDIVAVKAREPFKFCTSMSCLESDGNMHSFIVIYDETPENLIIDRRDAHPKSRMKNHSFERREENPFENLPSPNNNPFDFENLKYAKQDFFHIGACRNDIECVCKNIFVENDVYYFVFNLKNLSQTSYELSEPRFAIESKSHSRRKLNYEKQLIPRLFSNNVKIDPHNEGYMVFAFDKFSIPKEQIFNIYFYEKGGPRNFCISLNFQDLRQARKVKDIIIE